MSNANLARFYTSVNEIEAAHGRRSSGFVRLVERDGRLVPVSLARRRHVPVKGMLLAVASLVGFKAFLLMSLGSVGYAGRLELLEEGNALERAGALIMKAGPLTTFMAEQLQILFGA